MMMSLGLGPRLELRCEQRLELRQEFCAPTPPEAVRGRHGLKVADEVLKKYNVAGILIGGVAKMLWRGSDVKFLSRRKDVDVIVLSNNCEQHPEQWENGIDWWVSHRLSERPTNGGEVGLLWNVRVKKAVPAGLYLCPLELLEASIDYEKSCYSTAEWKISNVFSDDCFLCSRREANLAVLPVLSADVLRHRFSRNSGKVALYCK